MFNHACIVDNYYIKTLTNRYRENLNAPVTRQDFELAKRILASFDLIVITEWMKDANMTAYVSNVLNQPIREFVQFNKKPAGDLDRGLRFFGIGSSCVAASMPQRLPFDIYEDRDCFDACHRRHGDSAKHTNARLHPVY